MIVKGATGDIYESENWVIIDSDKSWLSVLHQTDISTNAGLLLTAPLEQNTMELDWKYHNLHLYWRNEFEGHL